MLIRFVPFFFVRERKTKMVHLRRFPNRCSLRKSILKMNRKHVHENTLFWADLFFCPLNLTLQKLRAGRVAGPPKSIVFGQQLPLGDPQYRSFVLLLPARDLRMRTRWPRWCWQSKHESSCDGGRTARQKAIKRKYLVNLDSFCERKQFWSCVAVFLRRLFVIVKGDRQV